MQLDLDGQELGQSELDIAGTLQLGLGEGKPDAVEIAGTLVVQNVESRFLLNGALRATGTCECGRCLQSFAQQWDVPVALMVLRDAHSEEQDGEMLVLHQRNGVVDLEESLRECTVLGFPQNPVCNEDCKGFCASCGKDLNKEACDCASDDYDPRWEGLPD